jgi:hypothetical protein
MVWDEMCYNLHGTPAKGMEYRLTKEEIAYLEEEPVEPEVEELFRTKYKGIVLG